MTRAQIFIVLVSVFAVLAAALQVVDPPQAKAAPLPTTATATPLPTAQIDGVAWDQVVSGDTVYVGGKFSNVRPAGAPAGVNTAPRANLLAYNIETGAYLPGFVANTNAQVLSLAMSPDGKTLYLAGDFTTVNGEARYRVAAVDAATGALRSFKPSIDYRVSTIVVTDSAVYAGGAFGKAGGQVRSRLVALNPTSGAVLPWAPSADGGAVLAMAMLPGSDRIVVGGAFSTLNGANAQGSGAISLATGATLSFPVNQVIKNSGTAAAIYSLRADPTTNRYYGTGYTFGADGNFEGTFSAGPSGNIVWINDMRGDHYDVFVANGVAYNVGHSHQIPNIQGGVPEVYPRKHWYANAETADPTGALQPPTNGQADFSGNQAPTLLHWFPEYVPGDITGATQASWTVEGNSKYLVTAGEFTAVDGLQQQGLVRFTYPQYAASQDRPRVSGPNFVPVVTSPAAGVAQVSFISNWDRDDATLDYEIQRGNAEVAGTIKGIKSHFNNLKVLNFIDDNPGVAAGATQRYRVIAIDGTGLRAVGDWVNVTISGSGTLSNYARAVLADNPETYRRLGGSGAATADSAYNWAGSSTGLTTGAPGAIANDPDKAATFNGSSSSAAQTSYMTAPREISTEAWIKTSTTRGGLLTGWSATPTGSTGTTSYLTYMGNDGKIRFGVKEQGGKGIASSKSYNDNQWHHVVATLDWNGMVLYVDGVQVASNPNVKTGSDYRGYWRIGGGNTTGFPDRGSSGYFEGSIDEVATYKYGLSAAQVAQHYSVGRGSAAPVNQPPVASFTATPAGLGVAFNASGSSDPDGSIASYAWTFGNGKTGTGVAPSHTYTASGTYTVGLTVTDNGGVSSSTSKSVTVSDGAGPVALLADDFGRTVANGWGTSTSGAAWTASGGAASFSVAGGVGQISLGAGSTRVASAAVTGTDVELTGTVSLDKVPAVGYSQVSFGLRNSGTSAYQGRVRVSADGSVQVHTLTKINGTAATRSGGVVAGLTYTPGMQLNVRVKVSGSVLQVKVWNAAGSEPAAWTTSYNASALVGLPSAGGVAVEGYLTSSATNAPVAVRVDNLNVTNA